MKILITGGSGFLGINLIRFLISKKQTDIVVLDFAEFDYPEKHQIHYIRGDIRNRDTVRAAMKDVSIIIHTAAALPLYSKADIYSTDVEGTRIMLDESLRNNVDRFIHISSTAVYGVPDHHPIRETDQLQGVGYYGEAKIMAENICTEYRSRGMCISIIRPKSFIGPERLGIFALLYEWAREGKHFPILGKGNNRYQFLDVEDLCEAIYLCEVKDKAIVNDTFNVGAKEFTTLKEDFQSVLDQAGFNKKILSFPASPAILFLKIVEFLKLSPLYQWIYETVCKDSFVSIEKAERTLGFRPKYSNKDALIRNYNWYSNNANRIKSRTGVSHRTPWKLGILNVLKAFL